MSDQTQVQTDRERARRVLLEIAENENELVRERMAAAEVLMKWANPDEATA